MEANSVDGFLKYGEFVSLVYSVTKETQKADSLGFASAPMSSLLVSLINAGPFAYVQDLKVTWGEVDLALAAMSQVLSAHGDSSLPPDYAFLERLDEELRELLVEIEETVEDDDTALILQRAVSQLLGAVRSARVVGSSEMRKGAFEAAQILKDGAPTSATVQPKIWRKVGATALTLLNYGLIAVPAVDAGLSLMERFSNDAPRLVTEIDCGWNPPALDAGPPSSATQSD